MKPIRHLMEQTKDHLPEVFQLDDPASHKRFFMLGTCFTSFSIKLRQTKGILAKFYLGHLNAIAKLYPEELVSGDCLQLMVHNLITPM